MTPRRAATRVRRAGRLFAALAVVGAAGMTTWTTNPAVGAAPQQEIAVLGKWRPSVLPPTGEVSYTASVRAFVDAGSRLLYAPAFGWVAAYDLDTLEPRGSGLAPAGIPTAVLADAASATLFMAFVDNQSYARARLDRFVSTPAGIQQLSSLDLASTLQGRSIRGIYRPLGSEVLYLLAELPPPRDFTGYQTGGGLRVVELSLRGLEVPPTVSWQVDLPGCWASMNYIPLAPAGIGYVPSQNAVYLGCGNGKSAVFASTVPIPRGVGRLALHGDPRHGPTGLPTSNDFTLYSHHGDYKTSDGLFDPISDRFVFGVMDTSGFSLNVFDATTNTYVGAVGAGLGNAVQQATFDPVLGRYYGLVDGAGLLEADVRTTPLSQGRAVAGFERSPEAAPNEPTTDGPMGVDPVTHRLFVKYNTPDFWILQDRVPAATMSLPADPDAATVDVEERPGVTQATFHGSVQGYGARLRQVGGASALVSNYSPQDGPALGSDGGSRELRAGYLSTVQFGDTEASAGAISVDGDGNTRGDVARIGPSEGEPVTPWPVEAVACYDFGGAAVDSRQQDGSRVSCDAGGHRAEAASDSRRLAVTGVATLDTGAAAGVSRRDLRRGAMASVTATARGVDILDGRLRIGSVEATAESVAHGRPGTASSTYRRTIRDVEVDGVSICKETCDPVVVAEQVNRALPGRVQIDFPSADAAGFGSKGGYQALVRRSPAEQAEQAALNEQPPDRVEVPALVVTLFQDTRFPSRSIIELAGVATDTHYGISLIGDGGGDVLPSGHAVDGPVFGVAVNAVDAGTELSDVAPTALVRGRRGGTGGGAGSVAGRVFELAWNGLGRLLDVLPVWVLLLTPVYLSARRWLLLERSSLVSGGGR